MSVLNGSSVSVETVSIIVRDRRIEVSSLAYGPSSIIITQIWNELQSAFISYIKLKQSDYSKQSNMKDIPLKVNTYLNKAGYIRKNSIL